MLCVFAGMLKTYLILLPVTHGLFSGGYKCPHAKYNSTES